MEKTIYLSITGRSFATLYVGHEPYQLMCIYAKQGSDVFHRLVQCNKIPAFGSSRYPFELTNFTTNAVPKHQALEEFILWLGENNIKFIGFANKVEMSLLEKSLFEENLHELFPKYQAVDLQGFVRKQYPTLQCPDDTLTPYSLKNVIGQLYPAIGYGPNTLESIIGHIERLFIDLNITEIPNALGTTERLQLPFGRVRYIGTGPRLDTIVQHINKTYDEVSRVSTKEGATDWLKYKTNKNMIIVGDLIYYALAEAERSGMNQVKLFSRKTNTFVQSRDTWAVICYHVERMLRIVAGIHSDYVLADILEHVTGRTDIQLQYRMVVMDESIEDTGFFPFICGTSEAFLPFEITDGVASILLKEKGIGTFHALYSHMSMLETEAESDEFMNDIYASLMLSFDPYDIKNVFNRQKLKLALTKFHDGYKMRTGGL